jgi:F0F1-type ATP synthase assembly protein I
MSKPAAPRSTHGDGMSQGVGLAPAHRSGVSIDPASQRTRGMYNVLSASSVGLELGVSVVLALLCGIWLDGQLGTEPWMMLLFLGFGLTAGFRGVLRAVRRAEKALEHG